MNEDNVTIVADSNSPEGIRLTTFEIKIPNTLVAALNTHRALSKNIIKTLPSADLYTLTRKLKDDPYIPPHWVRAKKAGKSNELLKPEKAKMALNKWLAARDRAITTALSMQDLGVDRTIINSLVAPWLQVRVVVTATEWDNFFSICGHHSCRNDLYYIALLMKRSLLESTPINLVEGQWHLPYVTATELQNNKLDFSLRHSVSRCFIEADTSVSEEQKLSAEELVYDQLTNKRFNATRGTPHNYILEHQAFSTKDKGFNRNFRGWRQYREIVEQ